MKTIECPLCKEIIKKNNLKGHCWYAHALSISKDPNKKNKPWDQVGIDKIKKVIGGFP